MIRRFRMSIENRILIPLVSIVLIVMLGFGTIFFVTEYQVFLRAGQEQGTALAGYINADIDAGGFWADPDALLQKYEDCYKGDELFIYAPDGTRLYGRRERNPGDPGEVVLAESAANRLGWRVVYSVDRKALILSIIEEQRYIILASIAMLIIIIQAGMLSAYSISAPIGELSETCAEISRTPSVYRPDAVLEYTRRTDEIGMLAGAFRSMMESMKGYTDQLTWTKALNESIVQNLPVGLLVYDVSGNMTFMNAHAESMLNVPDERDGEGRSLKEIVAGIVRKGDVLPPPAVLTGPEGRIRNMEFGSWKLTHPDTGEDWGTLITIDDVTYQRHMEEKISNDEKLAYTGRLAADVAHEAKNPLAGIRAGLQVLNRKMLSDRDRLLCGEMIREVDRVNLLISNLVNIARQRESEKTWVSLNALCDELLLLYSKVAENKGITFSVSMESNLRIVADEQEIRQIFINLVNNSFKAMDGGGVMIIGSRSEGGVTVIVADDGCGMDAEKLAAVMRGDRGGLGLSIVRRLTARNGGTFRMESAPGEGTRSILYFSGSKGDKT